MTGPLRSTITLLTDSTGGVGGSLYAAATWNTPYAQIADMFDSHVLAASQNGAIVVKHLDGDIAVTTDYPQATARSVVVTTLRDAIDQLMKAWVDVVGTAADTFRTAAVPTTLTAINTALGAPASANNVGQIVKRDGNGDFAARNITANTLIGLATIAAAVTDRVLDTKALGALAWSGTGASNTLTTALDGSYVNASGVLTTVAAGTTIPLTPSATNSQWQVIYFGETGTANVATGTLGGARSTATQPASAAYQPVWVFLPQNCVGVYSTKADWTAAGSPATKGYVDARPLPHLAIPGAAGGGGGATITFGVVVDAPGASTGTMKTDTGVTSAGNLLDILAGNGGTVNGQNLAPGHALRVVPALVSAQAPVAGTSYTAGVGLDQMLTRFLPPYNTANAVQTSAATAFVTCTTANPWTAWINGVGYSFTASSATNATAGAGNANEQRYYILDVAGGTPAFSVVRAATYIQTTTQVILAALAWDGTSLQPTLANIDTGAVVNFPSTSVSPLQVAVPCLTLVQGASSQVLTVTTALQTFPNMPPVTFRVPTACRCEVKLHLIFDAAIAAADVLYIFPYVDGDFLRVPDGVNAVGVPVRKKYTASAYTEEHLNLSGWTGILAPGIAHIVSAGAVRTATGTTTVTPYAGFSVVTLTAWRA